MTIRADATRLKLRPADPRRPRAIAPRQGQVLMDTDLAQQSTHLLDRMETESADSFGSLGRMVSPGGGSGFQITPKPTPDACGIGAGQGYLDGWQIQNAVACTLASQPHPRTDTTPVAPLMMAIKALVRHIDPVEEPAYADRGLGDAQAAGRTLMDWQVFPFAPTAGFGASPDCATVSQHPEWQKLIAPSTGTLTVLPDTTTPPDDPCSLAPQGGFSRGENLLYRIEVHGGVKRPDFPETDGARFGLNGLKIKMSRGNAAVLARITDTNSTDVTVTPPALDPLNWFAPGLFAEFVCVHDDVEPPDPALEERLFRVALATDTVVTLEPGAAAMAAKAKAGGWFLRLWDGFSGLAASGTETVDTTIDPDVSQDIDLGDGLKVRLGGGASTAVFRRGDYWTFSARADGTIDWPPGAIETPHGPETRYAPLAVLLPPAAPATVPLVEDCRIPAATLTDRLLLYRGGDGQEIPQPIPVTAGFANLPAPLRVAVMRGRLPVSGAIVRWSVPPGAPASQVNGQTIGGATVLDLPTTGPDGLCQVTWAIDQTQPAVLHRVQAELLSPTGNSEPHAVVFSAAFRTAASTSYQPGSCALLSNAKTVQNALDTLCTSIVNSTPKSLTLSAIRLLSSTHGPTELLEDKLILNGLEVRFDAFNDGIAFGIRGGEVVLRAPPFDPIVEVELDLPYPITDPDRLYWLRATSGPGSGPRPLNRFFAFQRIRLDGIVTPLHEDPAGEKGIAWRPSEAARDFLDTLLKHLAGQLIIDNEVRQRWLPTSHFERILCRLHLRSAHIWAQADQGTRIYLNAEHLGFSANRTHRELLIPERDPQRAADLDMYFYLLLRD